MIVSPSPRGLIVPEQAGGGNERRPLYADGGDIASAADGATSDEFRFGTGDFTISASVKPIGSLGSGSTILAKRDASTSAVFFTFTWDASGYPNLWTYAGGYQSCIATVPKVTVGKRSRVICSRSGLNFKFTVDGVSEVVGVARLDNIGNNNPVSMFAQAFATPIAYANAVFYDCYVWKGTAIDHAVEAARIDRTFAVAPTWGWDGEYQGDSEEYLRPVYGTTKLLRGSGAARPTILNEVIHGAKG